MREVSIAENSFLKFFENTEELNIEVSGDINYKISELINCTIKKNIKDFNKSSLKIEMEDLEFEDSKSILEFVSLIRFLLFSFEKIFIFHAPQVFAHTLYRTNMLRSPEKIILLETKKDIGYTS